MTTPIIVIVTLLLGLLIKGGPIGFNKKIEKEKKAFFAMGATRATKISGQKLQGFPPPNENLPKKSGGFGQT